jgi:hypothetical protein
LSNQAKESLTSEYNCNLPRYTPPAYSSNINGYMRNSTRLVEDHLKKSDKSRLDKAMEKAQRYERKAELIKINLGVVDSQTTGPPNSQPEYAIGHTAYSISTIDN